jgi:hypothetical protein
MASKESAEAQDKDLKKKFLREFDMVGASRKMSIGQNIFRASLDGRKRRSGFMN